MARFKVFVQRVAAGECQLDYVPDAGNGADFLTKFLQGKKFENSVRFATGAGYNGRRAVPMRSEWGDC